MLINGIGKICFILTLYFFSWTCIIQSFDLYIGLENSIINFNKFTFSWPLSLTNLVLLAPVKKENSIQEYGPPHSQLCHNDLDVGKTQIANSEESQIVNSE